MNNPKRKTQLDWGYYVTFTTQLTEADHARMLRQAEALGLNRSQFATLALRGLCPCVLCICLVNRVQHRDEGEGGELRPVQP